MKKNKKKKVSKYQKDLREFQKKFCTERFYVNVPGGRFELTKNNKLRRVA